MKKLLLLTLCVFFISSVTTCYAKNPISALNKARDSVGKKKYAQALEHYVWFFENSTEIEISLWPVKLSVCLYEWRELGNIYPPALTKFRKELLKRKSKLLDGYHDLYLFMEYQAFCEVDNKINDTIEMFLHFHNGKDVSFAKKIFTQIKYDLWKNGYFDICNEYITSPFQELKRIKSLYDIDKNFYNEEAIFLLIVLKKSGRNKDFIQVKKALSSHGLTNEIRKKIIELERKN